VADLPSGDHPVNSTNGAIEGQRERVTRAVHVLNDEQTLADGDQTLAAGEQTVADTDQTLSDADQTGAVSDQASSDRDQVAADSDQAASDRDLEHGVDPSSHEFSRELRQRSARDRGQSAGIRLKTAEQRDAGAQARDLAALVRDQAAAARDLAVAQRDHAYQEELGARAVAGADIVLRAGEQRKRAARHRAEAAEHRALAADDRRAALKDREQAARDRLHALVDREALARQLTAAETDAVTGVRTRAAGLTDLDHELDRCRRNNGTLVVAYIDVVGLKAVNDTDGHRAGDELLQRVVTIVRAHLRSYDLIIRLGGDEFLCVMSNVTLSNARTRFGLVADALAACPQGGAIRSGLAELAPEEDACELIARADRELLATRD
jgi:diguanylate cyclase (GGDEF)-like protein